MHSSVFRMVLDEINVKDSRKPRSPTQNPHLIWGLLYTAATAPHIKNEYSRGLGKFHQNGILVGL